ncbi:MAG TPA: choice-of-anchor P family protein [Burkholderiales bacterium]|jgi:hypothetical protein|nr:choice-of-anchor P family protein [Burkholderiales bacterium]
MAAVVAGVLAGLLAWPGAGSAQLLADTTQLLTGSTQTLTGQASAVTAVVLGTVTSLANTGTLTDPADPLGTGQPTGSIPGLLSAEALHAVTMGWTDQVASEASLGNLAMSVAGVGISADAIMSRALAVSDAGSTGLTSIEGLTIGGMSIVPAGVPNQQISIAGLSVILNEQIQTADGIIVNALHIRTFDGLTDVVIGSAKAGI